MPKFNKGDRVRCIESYQNGIFIGESGVVIEHDFQGRVGVRVDEYLSRRHGLQGRTDRGHGWWVPERCLEHEEIQDLGELPVLDIAGIL